MCLSAETLNSQSSECRLKRGLSACWDTSKGSSAFESRRLFCPSATHQCDLTWSTRFSASLLTVEKTSIVWKGCKPEPRNSSHHYDIRPIQEDFSFKTRRGLENVDYRKYFILKLNAVQNPEWKVELPRFKTLPVGKSFTYYICDTWNRLPAEVDNSCSVEQFKSRLDIHRYIKKSI